MHDRLLNPKAIPQHLEVEEGMGYQAMRAAQIKMGQSVDQERYIEHLPFYLLLFSTVAFHHSFLLFTLLK